MSQRDAARLPVAFEFPLETADHPARHFECRYLLNAAGQVLAIVRDITARKEAEARIHRLHILTY